MDSRQEISEFLSSRRARLAPEQVGFGAGGNRRVPGLRREEVAVLAGVSSEYYRRIERGSLSGVSEEVLGAIADALQLDEAETSHLFDLARATHGLRTRTRKTSGERVRPGIQDLIDSMLGVPAWVRNQRMDVLATNALGSALYAPLLASEVAQGNNARFLFLDPASRDYYPDWERGADDVVAVLRGYTGQNPQDKALSNLIGELVTQSTEFSRRWAAHNVKYHRTGTKRLHHPEVGELELRYEALELPSDPGLTLFTYFPQPETATAERLRLLASWAAPTRDPLLSRDAR